MRKPAVDCPNPKPTKPEFLPRLTPEDKPQTLNFGFRFVRAFAVLAHGAGGCFKAPRCLPELFFAKTLAIPLCSCVYVIVISCLAVFQLACYIVF